MRWLAVVLALALGLALALSACGGGDDSGDAAAPVQTTPSDTKPDKVERKRRTEKDGSRDGPRDDAEQASDSESEATRKPGRRGRPKTFEEALRRVSAARRSRLLTRALAPVIEVAGIKGSTFTLSADFRTLTIAVPARRACRVRTTSDSIIVDGTKDLLDFLDSVRVLVDGTDFASWVASNCDRDRLAGGRGVVLRESGVSTKRTRYFRINAKRWSIDFSHHGNFFSVFVVKGKRYIANPIVSSRPGSGHFSYDGPGRFRLDISGSGDWSVRVRTRG